MIHETREHEYASLSSPTSDTLEEIETALLTINKRSTGLLHFVESYRNLTRIPQPEFTIFRVADFYANLAKLLEQELNHEKIILERSIEPSNLEMTADEKLMEQVFINLIRNAIQALNATTNPTIRLEAAMSERGKLILRVEDNGQGIISEVLDKIFIPFFTTKPNGSGIGLSLSRQIIRLHGGTIGATSLPNQKTIFTIRI
jgi:two-component system, NtrC family, nitrogen regulation sensor histidine kinase NtrY